MHRLKLEVPEKKIAMIEVPVRISDINYGNHVGNDSFVSIIHEARMQWLKQHGYTELDIEGFGMIMSDLAVEFKAESLYGDQVQVEIICGDTGRVGFELYFRLFTDRRGKRLHLANARTGMICYDYTVKKPVSIPQKFLEILLG